SPLRPRSTPPVAVRRTCHPPHPVCRSPLADARGICNVSLHVHPYRTSVGCAVPRWDDLGGARKIRFVMRRAVLSAMPVVTALVLLAGCGGGSQVDCGLDG